MRLENGDLSELLSRNLCCCIHRIYKMGGFLSNFISVTLQTLGTMQLINAFGFNTIWTASFSHHTLYDGDSSFFAHLLFRLTTLPGISYLHSKNGWTWHITTLSIHSPFEFSSVNVRKTQDCVSQTDWNVLKSLCNMFHNPLPRFDVPSYSIHVDRGVHVLFYETAIARQIILTASHASDTSGLPLPPWQKVLV
jgi:hypothetical protein